MASVDQMRRRRKTALFLAIAILANSFGSLLLSLAMKRLPAPAQASLGQYAWSVIHDPFLFPGIVLAATYELAQLSLFSWADLSFVVPSVASSYVVTTLLAEFILGEQVGPILWLGVVLICLGVTLVVQTPVVTKPHGTRTPA
jgi:drug/metabolite transporter (DMT)-like permease